MGVGSQRRQFVASAEVEARSWFPHDHTTLHQYLAHAYQRSCSCTGRRRSRQWRDLPTETLDHIQEHVMLDVSRANVKIVTGKRGTVHVYFGGERPSDLSVPGGDGRGHGHIVIDMRGVITYSRRPLRRPGRHNFRNNSYLRR